MAKDPRLLAIWAQSGTPVIVRRTEKGQQHRLRIPFSENNYSWLRDGRPRKPIWDQSRKRWEIPKAWFNDFVQRALKRWGKLYVIQPYRKQEICARACMEAQGHECQCSCMGVNHGSGMDGSWFEVRS